MRSQYAGFPAERIEVVREYDRLLERDRRRTRRRPSLCRHTLPCSTCAVRSASTPTSRRSTNKEELTMELNICHLYPDILNLYGDRGNIITMKRRLESRGISVNVDECSIGQPLECGQVRHFLHRRRTGLRAGGAAARPRLRQGAGHLHRC
ncbi:MAG: hypothetical protein ACLR4Z_12790 [Butyricicoccaceae bacterium]